MSSSAGGFFRKTSSSAIDAGESLTWPTALHVVFGTIGGLLGIGVVRLSARRRA